MFITINGNLLVLLSIVYIFIGSYLPNIKIEERQLLSIIVPLVHLGLFHCCPFPCIFLIYFRYHLVSNLSATSLYQYYTFY